MNIAAVIRKYRKEAGLTQEEMANRLGVTTPAVNKWENGNSNPDIALLAPFQKSKLFQHMTFKGPESVFLEGMKEKLLESFRDKDSFGYKEGNKDWETMIGKS